MEITIEWQKPIQLTKHKKILVDEDDLPKRLEAKPGVYFFARRYGAVCLPFYIGESQTLRNRLRQHLASKRIADVLRSISGGDEEIKKGVRYFHFGYFIAKRGQQAKACLPIVQKVLIRQAVAAGYPILNSQLKKFRTHKLYFDGSKAARATFDRQMVVEAK